MLRITSIKQPMPHTSGILRPSPSGLLLETVIACTEHTLADCEKNVKAPHNWIVSRARRCRTGGNVFPPRPVLRVYSQARETNNWISYRIWAWVGLRTPGVGR